MNDIVSKYRASTTTTFVDTASEQNFALAVPAGLAAAVVGAGVWAFSVYFIHMKLGLVVILVGLMVGYAVRETGKGADPLFGILGAVCAAFAWALGTVLCNVAFLAKHVGRPFFEVLTALGVNNSVSMAVGSIEAWDFIFLTIAMWEGYQFSLVQKQA